MIFLGPTAPPPRECNCNYPNERFRNGSGHAPYCPIHWHYREDRQPGIHAAERKRAEEIIAAESSGVQRLRAAPSRGLFQIIAPKYAREHLPELAPYVIDSESEND